MFIINAGLPQVQDGIGKRVTTPESIYDQCRDMATCAQEMLVVLTLDTRNKMIARHLITLGLLESAPIHAREVFRHAIADNADSIILVHNHPSGDVSPSADDLRVTKRMIEAGRVLGIAVMDHVLIGRGEQPYLSLREKGLVTFCEQWDDNLRLEGLGS